MGTLEIAGIIMAHTIICSSDYNELYKYVSPSCMSWCNTRVGQVRIVASLKYSFQAQTLFLVNY